MSHLFNVAAGLDSMVVGEGQILGQTRDALRVGQELGTVGPALNVLFQQALRVGKRSRAETDIDRAAPSLVTAALERIPGQVAGRRVVVVGAGAMAVARRRDRAPDGRQRHRRGQPHAPTAPSASPTEYAARPVSLVDLDVALGRADVLISCTGATGVLISRGAVEAARAHTSAPLAIVDLALPHDVDPAAAEVPGVTLLGLAALAEELKGSDSARERRRRARPSSRRRSPPSSPPAGRRA